MDAPVVRASTDPQISDSPVTATIPSASASPGGDTIPPTVPVLLRPTDGSVTSDPTPEFVWRQAEDPNSNFVAYTLYIDGVPRHLGISSTGNSAKTGPGGHTATLDTTEVRLIPLEPLSDGEYKWKVSAYDNGGNETYSDEWTVIIDTTAPPVTVTDIDIHHGLTLSSQNPASVPEGTIFDITGPKDVYITIVTEKYTSVSITFSREDGGAAGHASGSTGDQTSLVLYSHLDLGTYIVTVSATDRANLVTILPPFRLHVAQPTIAIPVPGGIESPVFTVPQAVSSVLFAYPATVAKVTSRESMAYLIAASLAVALYIVIILLKKRSNLILQYASGQPLSSAVVTIAGISKEYAVTPRMRGRLYIPELARYTEIMIRTDSTVVLLCLSKDARYYVIRVPSES